MKEYLYHGSDYSGITELEACSKLHNTDKKVVYANRIINAVDFL